jgi:hypothetical protein
MLYKARRYQSPSNKEVEEYMSVINSIEQQR